MSDFIAHEAEGSDDDSLSSGEHPVSKRPRVEVQESTQEAGQDEHQEEEAAPADADAEAEPAEAVEEGEIASSEEDDEDSEEEEDEEEGVLFNVFIPHIDTLLPDILIFSNYFNMI